MKLLDFIISKTGQALKPADITLQDDGDGVYISRWNSEAEKPSKETVQAWVNEFNANPPKAPLTDAQRIASLMLQSAEKDAKIKQLEEQNAGNLMRLADKEIRLKNVESQNSNIMLKLAINGIK